MELKVRFLDEVRLLDTREYNSTLSYGGVNPKGIIAGLAFSYVSRES